MKTITRGEYLNALTIVDQYHRQFDRSTKDSLQKTPIEEWLHKMSYKRDISTRLYNVLTVRPLPFEYVEDINIVQFFKIRNAGVVCWSELKELFEIDNRKWNW